MESWSYTPEEKSYLFSEEMDFSFDAFMRTRKALVEWDNKASCNFEKDEFISDREVVKSMEFVDLGFPDLFRKSFHGSQPLETSSCDLDSNSSKRVNSSTHVVALDSPLGEEEPESKHSSPLVESKSHDSSLIDLKLGRLADCKDASSNEIAKEGLALSSIPPRALAKRARTSSSPTQKPVCQVYGCNMDLSSSKEYHKRHRVCDVHSKTAKVIVNGIEQRFCQQCSRFHLLAEFDDVKRSCRRRLQGHNERRRKPQFDYISGKSHKLLQSYQGAKYLGASLQKKPQFAFQDIFRSGIFYPEKYGQTNHSEHIKVEEEPFYSPQLAVSITYGQELSNSSCALSLLSAQAQDLSRPLVGNPMATSLTFQGMCSGRSDSQVSETPLAIRSMDKYVQNESYSCGANSMDVKNGVGVLSEADHSQVQVHRDDISQSSYSSNDKNHFTPEHGTTVDLFQLSSHLQRVEQQRNSFPVKRQNEDCCFPIV
ncbi:hypothetical protein L6164_027002 [Bauhinia variegata]|uniref:Uncharacterized protein n=1 Tax=Bauhinia variegata TaxID=167791 RepID=A0ACB9LTB8_BAUVA|nr:hypothetical protein L6164_027002 [Bauhinia variegata]